MNPTGSINFKFLLDNHTEATGLVLEGGSRSKKTVDTCLFYAWYMHEYKDKVITIGRDKLTTLKKTLLLDWKKYTKGFNFPDYNKTSMELEYNGNLLRFVGLNDDLMAAHGLGGNSFWINEAMSVGLDTFDQLEQRTEDFWILDYNPSGYNSWIYNLENREDVKFLRSTVLDNPFAPEKVVKKILSYEPWLPGSYVVERDIIYYDGKPVSDQNRPPPHPLNTQLGTADKYKWLVYGLGIRSQAEETVYKHWEYFDEDDFPDLRQGYKARVLGLDFGYTNDPTAVVEVVIHGNCIYATELVHETGLLMAPLADAIRPHMYGDTIVVCDRSRPDSRDELILRNIVVHSSSAKAGMGGIGYGIDVVKGYKLYINKKSVNLQNELLHYKYKKDDKTGDVLNTPIDKDNHLLDALRYASTYFAPQLIQ